MITTRKSQDRGFADHGWLKAKHSFSFGSYFDEAHMGFKSLRVINEDRVAPKAGFPTHAHRDMEIITYVISGALEHKDSMGNGSIIRPGDVQYMSAGTGVRHSEFNHSANEEVHLLQIWVLPDQEGHAPRYDQKSFSEDSRRNQLKLVVAHDSWPSEEEVIRVHQDVLIYASLLQVGNRLSYSSKPGRGQWVQVVKGQLEINGRTLMAGDALHSESDETLTILSKNDAEFLLFDLK